MSERTKTVSYTHLDVYKRQVFYFIYPIYHSFQGIY